MKIAPPWSHQVLTLMSCLYNSRLALGSPLQTVLSSSSSYKLVDDKHPRLAVTLDPGPDTRSPGPVAIHCAAGSPFVTVSQLTSPPEHPQFSVFPHEKIHGNLKTQPHFWPPWSLKKARNLNHCFDHLSKIASLWNTICCSFLKEIKKHQFNSSSFTSNLDDMTVKKTR